MTSESILRNLIAIKNADPLVRWMVISENIDSIECISYIRDNHDFWYLFMHLEFGNKSHVKAIYDLKEDLVDQANTPHNWRPPGTVDHLITGKINSHMSLQYYEGAYDPKKAEAWIRLKNKKIDYIQQKRKLTSLVGKHRWVVRTQDYKNDWSLIGMEARTEEEFDKEIEYVKARCFSMTAIFDLTLNIDDQLRFKTPWFPAGEDWQLRNATRIKKHERRRYQGFSK